MTETPASTPPASTPPACERCGTTTFPSRRKMLRHRLEGGKAIPQEGYADTWKCPRCGREEPRG
jgi:ribosomal protein L37E